MISGRRLINKGWFELDAGAGNGPVIGLKGSRNLSSKVFANGGLNLNFRRGAMLPGLVGSNFFYNKYIFAMITLIFLEHQRLPYSWISTLLAI